MILLYMHIQFLIALCMKFTFLTPQISSSFMIFGAFPRVYHPLYSVLANFLFPDVGDISISKERTWEQLDCLESPKNLVKVIH